MYCKGALVAGLGECTPYVQKRIPQQWPKFTSILSILHCCMLIFGIYFIRNVELNIRVPPPTLVISYNKTQVCYMDMVTLEMCRTQSVR